MRKAVAQRLGYDPFFPAAEKTIVSQIIRDRAELRGSVQLVDGQGIVRGMRAFKVGADECEELVAAMSLAISIAIDPTRASLSTQPSIEHAEQPRTGVRSPSCPARSHRALEVTDPASYGERQRHTPGFIAETGFRRRRHSARPFAGNGSSLSLGTRFRIPRFFEGRDLPPRVTIGGDDAVVAGRSAWLSV
jgi:hypothetical protein